MPKITALLHTHNDALRLGRALQSLRACDEVVVIDDSSEDETQRIARENGAIVKTAVPGVTPGAYAIDTSHEWILCLRPDESLSDDLEASLFEWKQQDPDENVTCYQLRIREENKNGWHERPPEARLVNRNRVNWVGDMPPNQGCDSMLNGAVLRFRNP